jgi:hypothetical protein
MINAKLREAPRGSARRANGHLRPFQEAPFSAAVQVKRREARQDTDDDGHRVVGEGHGEFYPYASLSIEPMAQRGRANRKGR